MAANTYSIETLKENSLRVYTGMTVVFPQFGDEEEFLDISELVPKFNRCFASNNSTVCYVLESEVFVTPFTRCAMRTLHSAGFQHRDFYVPFSNGDYPKAEKIKWMSLCEMAAKSYADDFIDDCSSYCDENHIGAISGEALQNSFEMPSSGVMVKHMYFEDCYYPILTSNTFDCVAIDRLGHYSTNNGIVVFVYKNGKTYVARSRKVLKELRAAGYTEKCLFVPFSNGEKILDNALRARWESVSK